MNCPGCERHNAAKRRYCGGCGLNLEPVCRACSFVNDRDDRYCGGCGEAMSGDDAARIVSAPPAREREAVTFAPHAKSAAPTLALVDELGDLFGSQTAVAEAPKLPEAGIAQNDLDRLFGVVP